MIKKLDKYLQEHDKLSIAISTIFIYSMILLMLFMNYIR